MKVKFSRHAKRRAKLYEIPEVIIEEILATLEFNNGKHELIENVVGFKYPIKIIISVENKIATVVTTYPLKRGVTQ